MFLFSFVLNVNILYIYYREIDKISIVYLNFLLSEKKRKRGTYKYNLQNEIFISNEREINQLIDCCTALRDIILVKLL